VWGGGGGGGGRVKGPAATGPRGGASSGRGAGTLTGARDRPLGRVRDESCRRSPSFVASPVSEPTPPDAARLLAPAGRVVMISGASRGLGAAIARRLGTDGYALSLRRRRPPPRPVVTSDPRILRVY